MGLFHYAFIAFVAFGVTFALVPLVKKLAVRVDAIDYPDKRRMNTEPIPRLGGLAIYGGIIAAICVELLGEHFLGWNGIYSTFATLGINHWMLLAGITFIVGVGVVDDIRSLSPGVKFSGQIIGALIVASSGVLLDTIHDPFGGPDICFGHWAILITVFYFVVFMNITNLIDGLDGLAAGLVAIAALVLMIIAIQKGRIESAFFSAILLGAVIAFLRFNFNPATIFMGDSGSLLLGAMLALTSLTGVMRSPALVVMVVPFMVAIVPLLDTTLAIIRRKARHQSIGHADKGHIHHRLVRTGLTVRKAVGILYAWTALLGVGAIIISNTSGPVVYVTFFVLAIVSIFILKKFHLVEPIIRHHYNQPQKPDQSTSDSDEE